MSGSRSGKKQASHFWRADVSLLIVFAILQIGMSIMTQSTPFVPLAFIFGSLVTSSTAQAIASLNKRLEALEARMDGDLQTEITTASPSP
jgi:hypothetical protein